MSYRIHLQNVQSHIDTVYTFEDNQTIEFIGENSNGKTVLGKLLSTIILGEYIHPDERLPLINDNAEECSLSFAHNEKALQVVLNREWSKCYYTYCPDINAEPREFMQRYISEGGLPEALYDIGFRTYGKNDFCLQIAPTFGVLPFMNTSPTLNGEVLAAIGTETIAEEFVNSYDKITYPAFRSQKQILDTNIKAKEEVLKTIEQYDYHTYEDKKVVYSRLMKALMYYPVEYVDLDIPTHVPLKDYPTIELEGLYIPKQVVPPLVGVKNLVPILDTWAQLLSQTCPYCQQKIHLHSTTE